MLSTPFHDSRYFRDYGYAIPAVSTENSGIPSDGPPRVRVIMLNYAPLNFCQNEHFVVSTDQELSDIPDRSVHLQSSRHICPHARMAIVLPATPTLPLDQPVRVDMTFSMSCPNPWISCTELHSPVGHKINLLQRRIKEKVISTL